jgi:hypothetical protein
MTFLLVVVVVVVIDVVIWVSGSKNVYTHNTYVQYCLPKLKYRGAVEMNQLFVCAGNIQQAEVWCYEEGL